MIPVILTDTRSQKSRKINRFSVAIDNRGGRGGGERVSSIDSTLLELSILKIAQRLERERLVEEARLAK